MQNGFAGKILAIWTFTIKISQLAGCKCHISMSTTLTAIIVRLYYIQMMSYYYSLQLLFYILDAFEVHLN